MARIHARMRDRRILFPLAAALVALAPLVVRAQDRVDPFRVKMEKWIEVRKLLSEEAAAWESERQMLRASRDLLAQEKQAIGEQIGELRGSVTAADAERNELLLRRGELERADRAMDERIRGLEKEVLALAPSLPEPLQDRLQLLLVQIPESADEARSSVGQRLMNVLGVLAQTEKFNSTATLVGETRNVGGDQEVQVRTLYWGLGQAVYAASRGEVAGIGRPGPNGWEFHDDPDLVPEARKLLDIYEGNVDAIDFVRMPVHIR